MPLEDTIVDCVKEWAFTDAFATLHQNYRAIDWNKMSRHYWERISRCNARVGQVLKYGTSLMARDSGNSIYPRTRATVKDEFVRRQIVEAVEKVIELG